MASRPVPVGGRIRDARIAKGLTQDQLAELVGVDQGRVSRWESGKRVPRIHETPTLIAVLGLSWSDFDPHRIAS
jgi:transcriptional regulator with XRE-family HTH domain